MGACAIYGNNYRGSLTIGIYYLEQKHYPRVVFKNIALTGNADHNRYKINVYSKLLKKKKKTNILLK